VRAISAAKKSPQDKSPPPPFDKLIVSHMLGGWTQGE
jgi:hypothetical protein